MIVKSGKYYKNKKNGKDYKVDCIAYDVTNNQEKEVVVYTAFGCVDELTYVRELSEFIDKFEESGL